MSGPLVGDIQTVPRGELRGLEVAIRFSSGVLMYVSDNRAVVDGWNSRAYRNPQGELGPIWREIGKLLENRDPSFITVIWVPSHLDTVEASERGVRFHFLLGNAVADEIAGEAAKEWR
eukprot:5024967-Pyramimonas_sp.AAC.1